MNTCVFCDSSVPKERIEALTEMNKVISCIACSNKHTPERVGFTIFDHKTAPSVYIVDKGGEAERKARAVYNRSR